jgi:hypothetical protein
MTIATRRPRPVARKHVLMRATIINADGTNAVRVHDLSSFGARIACERMLPANEDLIFKRGQLFVAARVAWSSRGAAGLEFYREISKSALAATFHPVFDLSDAAA